MRLFVAFTRVRSLAGTHEAVTCSVVSNGNVGFARGSHILFRLRDSGINTGIVAAIKAIDRRIDALHRIFVRRRSIENERRL